MSKRFVLRGLLALATLTLMTLAAAAQAAPSAPTAVRVRVAHLAPFAGSNTANLAVHVDGAAIGGTMAYGGHSAYQTLAAGPKDYTVEVLRGGTPVLTTTIALGDGDSSLVVIGDEDRVPLAVLKVDDNLADPGPGAGGLRVIHVAAIGATISETQVDVCSQGGELFHTTAHGLRYIRSTAYRLLPVGPYDLKVTRYDEATPCGGGLVVDLPVVNLSEGDRTTLYLVGDGPHQHLGGFTFEDGLLGGETPTQHRLYMPVTAASS